MSIQPYGDGFDPEPQGAYVVDMKVSVVTPANSAAEAMELAERHFPMWWDNFMVHDAHSVWVTELEEL